MLISLRQAAAALVVTIVFVPATEARTYYGLQQAIDVCRNETAQPRDRVEACTHLLQSNALFRESFAYAYLSRGEAFFDLDDQPNALADFSHAIEVDPQLELAFALRGMVYAHQHDAAHAMTDFNRAIELDAHDAVTLNNRALLFMAANDYPHAIADLDAAIAVNANEPGFYQNRGLAYRASGDTVRAQADFDHAALLENAARRAGAPT